MNQIQPNRFKQLSDILVAAPLYALDFILGLFGAVLSDPLVTSLTLGSVALGVALGVWVAIAAFFLLYTAIRAIVAIANAVGTSGRAMAMSVARNKPGP